MSKNKLILRDFDIDQSIKPINGHQVMLTVHMYRKDDEVDEPTATECVVFDSMAQAELVGDMISGLAVKMIKDVE